jgi:hypothetical protein
MCLKLNSLPKLIVFVVIACVFLNSLTGQTDFLSSLVYDPSKTYEEGDSVIPSEALAADIYTALKTVSGNKPPVTEAGERINTDYWATTSEYTAFLASQNSAQISDVPDDSIVNTDQVANLGTPSEDAGDTGDDGDTGGGGSNSDDPNLPNAGSTDVVLRGLSTTGYVSGTSKISGGFKVVGGSMSVLITGKGAKELLSTGQLQDTLNDPSLELQKLSGSSWAFQSSNKDWLTGSHSSKLTETKFFDNYENDDSGLYLPLTEGTYLAEVTSSDEDSGGTLVEIYNNYRYFDETHSTAKLGGISTNGIVNAGNEPGERMTAAIAVGNVYNTSANRKRVIIMAKHSYGVTLDALDNPRLEVRDIGNNIIASNNDWISNSQSVKNAITTTRLMNGYRDTDAAVIVNIGSGNYYIDVYSEDADSGGALVEIYDLDLLEDIHGWNLGN